MTVFQTLVKLGYGLEVFSGAGGAAVPKPEHWNKVYTPNTEDMEQI